MVATGDPVVATDITSVEDYTIRKPLVRLIQTAAQTISSATDTAVTFTAAGSEDIDTHGFHDTSVNTSRITPTIAGYYRLFGAVHWAADTDIIRMDVVLSKNGTVIPPRQRHVTDSTATASAARATYQVSAMFTANGTTDYFELVCNQLQAVAGNLLTVVSGSQTSAFECEFLRPL